MRKKGLEPSRCNHHKILSLARLPVPTLPRNNGILPFRETIVNNYFFDLIPSPEKPGKLAIVFHHELQLLRALIAVDIKIISDADLHSLRFPEVSERISLVFPVLAFYKQ